MSAARRWLLLIVLVVLATAAAGAAPRGLRRMDSFHVQTVEVLGARYLTPAEAVAASGITATSSVFDDFGPWRAALRRHPLVLDVRVERRLPATLVLHVEESRPLAFARVPDLRPVDARGRLLTTDPTQVPLDLPVLVHRSDVRADVQLSDSASLRTLRTLGQVAALEPALFALASAVETLPDGVRLVLRAPAGAELILPFAVDAARLHLLRLTLADVSGGEQDTLAAGRPVLRRIDARYREQFVVALQPSESH